MKGFGPHLTLDGYRCDQKKLEDIEHVYRLLDEVPAEIGMTKIMPPYVFRYDGSKPEDWGISGFVLIAESHISIHTYPEKRYLSADIFSCKEFDIARAIGIIKQRFGIESVEHTVLARGTEFPKDIAKAAHLVRGDRNGKENVREADQPRNHRKQVSEVGTS
jgi:S-adenosylmethionine decarboxylase